MNELLANGESLTIEDVEDVARHRRTVGIDNNCDAAIEASRQLVLKMVQENRAVYGVTTGIGEFARVRIDPDKCEELQRRIIMSHCASTGDV